MFASRSGLSVGPCSSARRPQPRSGPCVQGATLGPGPGFEPALRTPGLPASGSGTRRRRLGERRGRAKTAQARPQKPAGRRDERAHNAQARHEAGPGRIQARAGLVWTGLMGGASEGNGRGDWRKAGVEWAGLVVEGGALRAGRVTDAGLG